MAAAVVVSAAGFHSLRMPAAAAVVAGGLAVLVASEEALDGDVTASAVHGSASAAGANAVAGAMAGRSGGRAGRHGDSTTAVATWPGRVVRSPERHSLVSVETAWALLHNCGATLAAHTWMREASSVSSSFSAVASHWLSAGDCSFLISPSSPDDCTSSSSSSFASPSSFVFFDLPRRRRFLRVFFVGLVSPEGSGSWGSGISGESSTSTSSVATTRRPWLPPTTTSTGQSTTSATGTKSSSATAASVSSIGVACQSAYPSACQSTLATSTCALCVLLFITPPAWTVAEPAW
mmetsp:Transcript_1793/g.4586  ORF Transcript_1793/g.4586 Transcript_1793/m.4586 type:complete len:292 (-) Transcript_1793:1440-2315(-)